MKDLIKDQTDMLREKFVHRRLHEADPPKPPAGGAPPAGGEGGEEPKKLKIDIPDTPFEPDVGQIKDRLKQILKQWEEKQYPSDKHRWQSYYKDILKLVRHLDGDK
tara:strand:- start:435 stop:752 length:318 start_codon:yes stop_codon:yes gene_type:complete